MVAAGMEVEARDADQQIPLHLAAWSDLTQSAEVMRELILQHNANMFAVDNHGRTPSNAGTVMVHSTRFVLNPLLEIYGNKLRQEDGPLFHSILLSAEYAYVEGLGFHPPLSLNNLQIHIPLGKLLFQHFRILLQYLGTDLIRNRDASGKLPIHFACASKAPVKVLALLLEHDAATLLIADYSGALPLHECSHERAEYERVRFLVEQGGVGSLAARDHQGTFATARSVCIHQPFIANQAIFDSVVLWIGGGAIQ